MKMSVPNKWYFSGQTTSGQSTPDQSTPSDTQTEQTILVSNAQTLQYVSQTLEDLTKVFCLHGIINEYVLAHCK